MIPNDYFTPLMALSLSNIESYGIIAADAEIGLASMKKVRGPGAGRRPTREFSDPFRDVSDYTWNGWEGNVGHGCDIREEVNCE